MNEQNKIGETSKDKILLNWTTKRRAALVIEILRGQTTVAEAARTHALKVSNIELWKESFLMSGSCDSLEPTAADELASRGFVLIPKVLEVQTLLVLRAAVTELLEHGTGDDFLRSGGGDVRKVLYPLAKHHNFLLALAHPDLMKLALDLCPRPEQLVLTWEDLLIKPPYTGLAVPVHQDIALQSVQGGVFSLGVHLDDGLDNPLRFIPGSHLQGPLTRAEVRQRAATETFVAVHPMPGDVLAHDVLVIHASDENLGPRPRWTWYLEYRTLAHRHGGPWPEEWWLARRALLFHAAAAREAAGLETCWPPCGPGETREGWLKRPCILRVPHEGGGVAYDLTSPYHHFG